MRESRLLRDEASVEIGCGGEPGRPKREERAAAYVRAGSRPLLFTDPEELGKPLRAIDVYEGYPSTRFAPQIAPHVFVRRGELRHAEWDVYDFEAAFWSIPAGKMKSPRPHAVPLSRQLIAILEEARTTNGWSQYVFRSLHAREGR